MMNVLIWTGLMLAVFAGLFMYTAVRLGGVRPMLAYYRKNPTYKDWLPLVYLAAPVMVLLTFCSPRTEAAEFSYLRELQLYGGLEVPMRPTISPVCREDQTDSVDNRLTSNLGVRQHLIGYGGIDIWAQWTHHSCAVDRDFNVYDAIGIQATWTVRWR